MVSSYSKKLAVSASIGVPTVAPFIAILIPVHEHAVDGHRSVTSVVRSSVSSSIWLGWCLPPVGVVRSRPLAGTH